MKKKTAQTITIIIVILLMCFADTVFAQNVRKDAQGNYIAISQKATDSSNAKLTNVTYTDSKGIVYKVYQSEKGKLFVRKISKNGNLTVLFYQHCIGYQKIFPNLKTKQNENKTKN